MRSTMEKPCGHSWRVELIAFDLNGTILERGETIPPIVKSFLGKVVKHGVRMTTASGRTLEDQLQIFKKNGLGASAGFPHYIIANEQEIYILEGSEYKPYIQHNSKIRDSWLKVLPEAKRIINTELERLNNAGIKVKRDINDEEAVKRGILDLLFERVEDAKNEEKFLKNMLISISGLSCNRNYRLVQIIHSDAGKGATLKALATLLNIPSSCVLCIGDSSNDLSMLNGHYGFLTATASNADEDVKEAVRNCNGYIASKPFPRGIIEILRYYMCL